jgi:hypothetical protein
MLARSTKEAMMRRFLTVLAVLLGICAAGGVANAQEIQLTGPLAGAPAVRQLRLHRQNRLEVAPTVSFTLLDEYQRTILVGGKLNYNITDWVAIGAWGAFGAVHTTTGLTDHIQEVTQVRRGDPANGGEANSPPDNISINNRLTQASIGNPFKDQLGKIDYVFAPQITLVPFRGKLAIFQKIFVDTDAYIFGGPAFVGLTERADCAADTAGSIPCDQGQAGDGDPYKKGTKNRTALTGTFGLGLTFYMGKFMSLGLEWRALPFAWNTGGFDTRGADPGGRFPDRKIDDKDRAFKFNQLLSVSLGFYFPTLLKSSE